MDSTLESLLAEEAELQVTRFDEAQAWKMGLWLVTKARKEGLKIAVSVTRLGQRAFHWAADGTCPDNDAWIDRKNRTVYRWGHSTFYMGRKLATEAVSAEAKYHVDEREFAFDGGGYPIRLKGVGVVGTVTVSGLKQHLDHALAVEALRYLVKKPTT